jgi:O-antigen/teichoic acid export membrane protein
MCSVRLKPSQKEETLSKKIMRSVIFGGLRCVLVMPIQFFLTPLILVKIGAAGYGTWAVFRAVNGMTSLADLGLVATLSKFVAEYYATRDYVSLNRLLNTGLVLFGILSLLVSGVLWAGTSVLVRFLFRGTSVDARDLTILFRLFLTVVAANILVLLFASVTSGLQRLDVTNSMGAFNTVVASALDAVLLLRGWGLRGLVYGQIVAALFTLLGYLVLVRWFLPQARFIPSSANLAEAKRIFSFSLRLYFTQAAVVVHNNIEKLLLASLVGVPAAGWYDIANDVALKIRGAVGIILSPVMTAASELGALKDDRRLVELYYRSHKYLAFVGAPVVCYMAMVSGRFVSLWIGPHFQMVAVPLAVLVFVNMFNLTTGPGFLIFAGGGNLGPGIKSALVGIALNAGLSWILIYSWGFRGAVVGTSISIVLASLYFLYLFHRLTGNSAGKLWRESVARPVLCSLGIVGITRILPISKDPSWWGIVFQGLLFGSVYLTAVMFSRFFDAYDWGKIESILPVMRYARRIVPVA